MPLPLTPIDGDPHVPSGNRCDAGAHSLDLCVNCSVLDGVASECCPCERCRCCKAKEQKSRA